MTHRIPGRFRFLHLVLFLASVASVVSAGDENSKTPKVSEIVVSDVTAVSAVVSWNTDSPSDTFVAWGTDPGFGHDAGELDTTAPGVTKHSVKITGLNPATSYNFVVRSRGFTRGEPDRKKAAFESAKLRFKTEPAPKTGAMDYSLRVDGPHHVTQGYPVFIAIRSRMTQGEGTTTYVTVAGLPPYTAIHWPDQESHGLRQGAVKTKDVANDTLQMYRPDGTQFSVQTNVGGTTPVGKYTLKVYSTTGNDMNGPAGPSAKPVLWDLYVEAPVVVPQKEPASYPKIPNLGEWKANMDYAAKWGPEPGCGDRTPPGFGELCAWYYDGIRVFYQMGDYTGKPEKYTKYIEVAKYVYRDNYLLKSGTTLWRRFPQGFYMDYQRIKDEWSKKAVLKMSNMPQGEVAYWHGFFLNARVIREATYQLDVDRYGAKLGDTRAGERIAEDATIVLGTVDQIVSGDAEWVQPFMCGLVADSLIQYYEDGHRDDVRVPIALKRLADWLWENAWQPKLGTFYYNSYMWKIGMYDNTDKNSGRDINLLVAPLYAWLFRYTGDATYQKIGDEIWSQGVQYASLNWSGKIFSQNYRWSFDYVKWRSQ